MTFRVGQKVVCVDSGPTWTGAPCGLVLNAIYTIAAITYPDPDGGLGVDLVEASSWEDAFHRASYRITRFRPVVERKTDISALRALLVPGSKIMEDVQ